MTRIAVCGHRSLDQATTGVVDRAIRTHLAKVDNLIGISRLADGADQIFARAVLDAGGRLLVVIPAEGHRETLPWPGRRDFDSLLRRAFDVVRLGYSESSRDANLAAARHMLERADQLLAVWNGRPANSHGGPADVVREAVRLRIVIQVIWPARARP